MRIPRAAAHERVIAAACLRHVVSSEVHLGEARVKYGIHENVAYVIVEIVHLHKDMKWENIFQLSPTSKESGNIIKNIP